MSQSYQSPKAYTLVQNAYQDHDREYPNGTYTRKSTGKHSFKDWVDTLWPLLLHFGSAMCITGFIIGYVDGNHFNLTERRPMVLLADGTKTPWSRSAPLQSDIATILSSSLMLIRWIVAGWAGSLGWRSAFLLMERLGLRIPDLKALLRFGLFTPHTYVRHKLTLLVGTTLLATIAAQSASPGHRPTGPQKLCLMRPS
jgi:hypothetical protein